MCGVERVTSKLDGVCLNWSQVVDLGEAPQITACKKKELGLFGCLLNSWACVADESHCETVKQIGCD